MIFKEYIPTTPVFLRDRGSLQPDAKGSVQSVQIDIQ